MKIMTFRCIIPFGYESIYARLQVHSLLPYTTSRRSMWTYWSSQSVYIPHQNPRYMRKNRRSLILSEPVKECLEITIVRMWYITLPLTTVLRVKIKQGGLTSHIFLNIYIDIIERPNVFWEFSYLLSGVTF